MPDEARTGVGRKMHAGHDRVEREHEFGAGPRRHDCGIVADRESSHRRAPRRAR